MRRRLGWYKIVNVRLQIDTCLWLGCHGRLHLDGQQPIVSEDHVSLKSKDVQGTSILVGTVPCRWALEKSTHSSATALETLVTCIDGLCGKLGPGPARYCGSSLDYNQLDDRLLASRMGTTRRDALRSVSCANSSNPGDLPSTGTGPAVSLSRSTPPCTERQDFFYRGGSEWRHHRHEYRTDL
jgi:hypothetical protein